MSKNRTEAPTASTEDTSDKSQKKVYPRIDRWKMRVSAVLAAGTFLMPMMACNSMKDANKTVWPDQASENEHNEAIRIQNQNKAQAESFATQQAVKPSKNYLPPTTEFSFPQYPKCEVITIPNPATLSDIAYSLGFTDPYDNEIAKKALQLLNGLENVDEIKAGYTLKVFRTLIGYSAGCVPQ